MIAGVSIAVMSQSDARLCEPESLSSVMADGERASSCHSASGRRRRGPSMQLPLPTFDTSLVGRGSSGLACYSGPSSVRRPPSDLVSRDEEALMKDVASAVV